MCPHIHFCQIWSLPWAKAMFQDQFLMQVQNLAEYINSAYKCGLLCVQFEGFAKGFMLLCGGPALHLFSATELERLVCGNPILDFKELQANARYEAGFGPEHRVSHYKFFGSLGIPKRPKLLEKPIYSKKLQSSLHDNNSASRLKLAKFHRLSMAFSMLSFKQWFCRDPVTLNRCSTNFRYLVQSSVCSLVNQDIKDLAAQGRFDVQVVKWLWEVVHEFTEDEQRHFLKFFTGSDRAPIGGLGNQRCLIQVPLRIL